MNIKRYETVFRPSQWAGYCLVGVVFLTLCWWNVAHGQSNVRMLEVGDVILSVNGVSVNNHTELTNAVNRSPQTMNFTIRDVRTRQVLNMQVTLNSSTPRFGTYTQAASGGGTMITGFTPNAAARRCILLGSGGNTGGGNQGGGSSSKPKIHMLFVWGTKATDTYYHTMLSKEKIKECFGDPKNDPDVGTYETLEGDNAHPQNILAACQRISQKAGPNDAVFVYFYCIICA